MLTRRNLLSAGVTALAATALGASGLAGASKSATPGAACPGKIVCPLTGELICRDQCPRVDLNRADCPGRIECPLTGELVCKDRCPLDGQMAAPLPECCAAKNVQ